LFHEAAEIVKGLRFHQDLGALVDVGIDGHMDATFHGYWQLFTRTEIV
jgi:hypothetical protein